MKYTSKKCTSTSISYYNVSMKCTSTSISYYNVSMKCTSTSISYYNVSMKCTSTSISYYNVSMKCTSTSISYYNVSMKYTIERKAFGSRLFFFRSISRNFNLGNSTKQLIVESSDSLYFSISTAKQRTCLQQK